MRSRCDALLPRPALGRITLEFAKPRLQSPVTGDECFDRSGCDAGVMIDRPGPLGQLDGYFAAARIAHEYVADMHRELVELHAAGDHTRELLRESAAVVFGRMPALTSRLRDLGRKWAEQELLDPPAAERTIERLEVELAKLAPALTALRTRQNEIAAELLDIVGRAR